MQHKDLFKASWKILKTSPWKTPKIPAGWGQGTAHAVPQTQKGSPPYKDHPHVLAASQVFRDAVQSGGTPVRASLSPFGIVCFPHMPPLFSGPFCRAEHTMPPIPGFLN